MSSRSLPRPPRSSFLSLSLSLLRYTRVLYTCTAITAPPPAAAMRYGEGGGGGATRPLSVRPVPPAPAQRPN